jgi:hypothetical protein
MAMAADAPTAPGPRRGKAKKMESGQVAEGERRSSGVPQKPRTRTMCRAYCDRWMGRFGVRQSVSQWGGERGEPTDIHA